MAIPRDYAKRNAPGTSVDPRHRHSGGGFLTTKHIDSRVNVSAKERTGRPLIGPASAALKTSSRHERIFVNKIYGR